MSESMPGKPGNSLKESCLAAYREGVVFPLSGFLQARLSREKQSVNRKCTRTKRAQFIAELPVVLWVMIILLMIPLIDIVTFTVRYTFLLAASRDAASAAALAPTFLTNASSTNLSAVNTATATAQSDAAAWSVITVNSVTTKIIITQLSTGTLTIQSTPLSTPADTANYAYQIQTIVNGSTNPILQFPNNMFWGAIPGLTAPVNVSIASTAYFENPQGLNL